MLVERLIRVGLTRKEAEVYLLLLRYGASRASVVCKRVHNINRTQVYALLESLSAKGYLERILQNGKALFVANEPSVFVQKSQHVLSEAKALLDDLHNIQMIKSVPVVRTFQGLKGIQVMTDIFLDEAVSSGGEMLQMGQEIRFVLEYPELIEGFIRKRKERKIPLKLICNRFDHFNRYLNPQRDPVEFREVRLVDPKDLDVDSTTYLYGNSMAVLSLAQEMQGYILTSPNVTSLNRQMFFLLWNKLDVPY
jgi:sugar-specific transcriptional regulator TrmB